MDGWQETQQASPDVCPPKHLAIRRVPPSFESNATGRRQLSQFFKYFRILLLLVRLKRELIKSQVQARIGERFRDAADLLLANEAPEDKGLEGWRRVPKDVVSYVVRAHRESRETLELRQELLEPEIVAAVEIGTGEEAKLAEVG